MNLGAGRIGLQDLPRIDAAIADGSVARNPAIERFSAALRKSGGTAHLMGLMSPGGVHSHQDHIAALANILRAAGVPVAVHAFLDGRDTPPASARDYLAVFMAKAPDAPVATGARSEEHTSELQSLMRISYAVFCLKKNKHKNMSVTVIESED